MALQGHPEPQPTPHSQPQWQAPSASPQPDGHSAAKDLVGSQAWADPALMPNVTSWAPGGSSCRKEAVLPHLQVTRPLAARARHPSCLCCQAGRVPRHRPQPQPVCSLPGWICGSLPHPSLLLLEDPRQGGCHGAQLCVGTCELANGAREFCPEMGQNESLSEERKGHESKRKLWDGGSSSSHPTQAI
ncbi:hypothetical protein H8958_000126 [Nasalis larvatus]